MLINGLTIYQRKSALDGIVLYEPSNVRMLEKLIHSKISLVKGSNIDSFANEKKKLEHYKTSLDTNKGMFKVQYQKPSGNPYGRANPYVENYSVGLHTIKRELRHTLVGDTMADIDIDNAHPTMLYQKLKANRQNVPFLEDYVKNRERWFFKVRDHWNIDKILDGVKDETTRKALHKDIPKNLFILMLFGGGIKTWAEKWSIIKWKEKTEKGELIDREIKGVDTSIPAPPSIYDFVEEIRRVQQLIADSNPEIVKKVKEIKEAKEAVKDRNGEFINLNGSVCSYYLQEHEIRILEVMFQYCCSKGYIKNDVAVLCADGLMIMKEDFKPELLKELNDIVFEETGFDLSFSQKEMNQVYDEKVINANMLFELWMEGHITSSSTANYMKMMYPNKFLYVKDCLYAYNGVYWKPVEDKAYAVLHKFIGGPLKDEFMREANKVKKEILVHKGALDDDNEEHKKLLVEYDRDLKKLTDFEGSVLFKLSSYNCRLEFVKEAIVEYTDNTIVMDNKPNLFAFDNKIYDLQKGEFVPPNYTQYISKTTGWNWSDYYSSGDQEEFERILRSIFPNREVRDYYLTILATGLYGVLIQNLFIAKGVGGNGKSVLNELFQSALGGYSYKLPSSVLLNQLKEGGNPEVANMAGKRGVIADEPEPTKRIATSTIKALTGSAKCNARQLHSNNTSLILLITLILECNNLPRLDEINQALARRIRVIPFQSVFVDKDQYDLLSPEERKTRNIAGVINPYYTTDDFKCKYRQALMVLMMEQFKAYRERGYLFPSVPATVKEATKDYMMASDDFYGWFMSDFRPDEEEEGRHNVIGVDELYSKLTSSSFWRDTATYEYKRQMTKKKFEEMVKTNTNIQNHLIFRDKSFQKVKYKKLSIWGFQEKTWEEKEAEMKNVGEADEDEEDETTEEDTEEEEEEEEEVKSVSPPPMPMIRRKVG